MKERIKKGIKERIKKGITNGIKKVKKEDSLLEKKRTKVTSSEIKQILT